MKLISLRCPICEHWHHVNHGHCPACGSVSFLHDGKRMSIDAATHRSIVRGIPLPMHKMVRQDWGKES